VLSTNSKLLRALSAVRYPLHAIIRPTSNEYPVSSIQHRVTFNHFRQYPFKKIPKSQKFLLLFSHRVTRIGNRESRTFFNPDAHVHSICGRLYVPLLSEIKFNGDSKSILRIDTERSRMYDTERSRMYENKKICLPRETCPVRCVVYYLTGVCLSLSHRGEKSVLPVLSLSALSLSNQSKCRRNLWLILTLTNYGTRA
jgi:hypothetical protein